MDADTAAHARFPRGPQVQKYIEAFAEHFSLNEHVKFGTSVSSLQKLERGWLVTHSRAGSDDDATTEHFDFVVVATGMYGGASPHLPAADGMEGFDGEVLHSFHFRELGPISSWCSRSFQGVQGSPS